MQFIMQTYLLLMLFQYPASAFVNLHCLKVEPNNVACQLSFGNEDDTFITLDNCATNHIFGDEADFHGGVIPMNPIDITGLGEGTATGHGNVKLEFMCDKGRNTVESSTMLALTFSICAYDLHSPTG